MTPIPSTATSNAGLSLPGPDTLVLLNRTVRAGTDRTRLSRFGQDRWVLTPAIHHKHANAVAVDFAEVPEPFRRPVKQLIWLLLNHDIGSTSLAYQFTASRPAISTIRATARFLRAFTQWLHARGTTRFAEVTGADLDAFAIHIRAAEVSHNQREDMLATVMRAWNLRHLLAPEDRLPQAPPWDGERIRDVLGQGRQVEENRTPRIHPNTMTALLSWSLRFIEVFADDIIAAFTEYKTLSTRNYHTRVRKHGPIPASKRRPYNTIPAMLADLFANYRARNRPLPGRRDASGTLTINNYFLGLQLDAEISKRAATAVAAELGMAIGDDTYLFAPITATLDDRQWLDRPITYEQAPDLARHLSAACFVIISYLSGQRPGETLNLERGCIEHDTLNDLILLRGKHFKGVQPPAAAEPDAELRADPWVIVAPVVTAIEVVQRLHEATLLFPNILLVNGKAGANALKARAAGAARTSQQISHDINAMIGWVNDYCRTHGRTDAIPADPTKPAINASRLRRTLAWFIVRRPRGLIAAAIQYGHVRTRVTLGYAGSYASGFPDDLVFEEWLARLDTLADAHHRLDAGEHISGPAADTYRERVTASTRFAGRVLRQSRDAAAILANPDLHIFPGKGMTCVLVPAKAACRLTGDDHGTRRTPDITDCRPNCANIARTDTDIDHLRDQVTQLHETVEDSLAPPIRHAREQHELVRLQQIITDHDQRSTP